MLILRNPIATTSPASQDSIQREDQQTVADAPRSMQKAWKGMHFCEFACETMRKLTPLGQNSEQNGNGYYESGSLIVTGKSGFHPKGDKQTVADAPKSMQEAWE